MNHACAGPLRNFNPMKKQHPCTSFCDELNLSSTCYLQQPPVVSAICIFSPTLPIGLKIYFNLILHIILHRIYFGRTIVTNKEKNFYIRGTWKVASLYIHGTWQAFFLEHAVTWQVTEHTWSYVSLETFFLWTFGPILARYSLLIPSVWLIITT